MRSLLCSSFIAALLAVVVAFSSTADASSSACFSNPSIDGFQIPLDLLEATDPASYGMCKPGWYCPFLVAGNASTYPRICPPDDKCLETRLGGDWCEPQGPFEPTPCPYGSYCPTATQKIICPKGNYCPIGSLSPRKCSPFAYCPEGTSNEYDMVGILVVGIIDILIIVGVLVYRHKYRSMVTGDTEKRAQREEEEMKKLESTEEGEGRTATGGSLLLSSSNVAGSPKNFDRLFSLYDKAREAGSALFFRFNKLSVKIPKDEVASNQKPAAGTDTSAEPEDKTLLAGVTGRFKPGTVTAIMGPSGAGKTVFLSTLLDKISTSWIKEGELNVNRDLSVSEIRHVVGFVPQDDVLHTELTVEQNLYFSSETRLPQNFTPEERAEIRDEVLRALQLEHVRHVQIGDGDSRGVSGGQRKRCSIGVELAACPTALFLDEPTTGLDAATALELCTLLKRLSAGTATTVAMVVHQPRVEIWNALDQVLLLAPGGRTVYQGPQADAKEYFSTSLGLNFEYGNPADIILDGIAAQGDIAVEMWSARLARLEAEEGYDGTQSPTRPPATKNAFEEAENNGADDNAEVVDATATAAPADDATTVMPPASIPPARGASFGRQVVLSAERMLLKINTSIVTLVFDVLLGTIACIIMGTAKIREDWLGVVDGVYALVAPKHKLWTLPMICMFYMLAVASAVAPGGIRTFGQTMTQYWREASNGHNKLAHFIGYTIVDFLRCIVTSFHFCLVAYLMSEPFQNFWEFYLFTALLFLCVDSQSAMLSMWLQPDTAPLLSTVIAVFMGLLNGYPNIPFLGPISYAWWTTQGWMGAQVDQVDNIFSRDVLEEQASWSLSNRGLDIAMCFVIYFVYRLLAFLLLIGLNREKQR